MKLCQVPDCFQPVFGKGFCRNHQHLRTDKDQRTMQQRSYDKAVEQKKKGIKTIDDFIGEEKSIMDLWFIDKIAQMTGRCANCGGKTTKGIKKYERYSIAHILAKAHFDSVKTHPFNWIELCYFNGCCHSRFDNGIIGLEDMNCVEEMVARYTKFEHLLTSEERARKEVARFEKLKLLLKQ